MMRIITIAMLFTSVGGFTQTNSSIVHFKNPTSVWKSKGFSQAVTVDPGNCEMIIISGQVPLDVNGNLVGKDDLAKQTEQVFLNIKNVIADAGGSMDNLVKLSVFVKDVSQIQKFREVRDRFINTKNSPASTLAEVSKLFRDDVLLEVEATAVIPKQNNNR